MKTGYSISKEVSNSFLERQRDPARLRGLWWLVAVVLPFAAAALAYTWVHDQGLQAGYRIEQLERQLEELRQQERLLESQATRLARPDRLSALAREQLGMAPPTLEQMVFLSSESASIVAAGLSEEPAR